MCPIFNAPQELNKMDEVGEWQEESSLSEGGWGHMGLAAHNKTEVRAAGRYWPTRLTMSIQSLTLTVLSDIFFSFLAPPSSSVLLLLAPYDKYVHSCLFFPLTCTTFSGTSLYFSNTPVLIYALRRAPGSENNGSARYVEPKVFSTIKMFFFWIE